jgi:hypothetical protein
LAENVFMCLCKKWLRSRGVCEGVRNLVSGFVAVNREISRMWVNFFNRRQMREMAR